MIKKLKLICLHSPNWRKNVCATGCRGEAGLAGQDSQHSSPKPGGLNFPFSPFPPPTVLLLLKTGLTPVAPNPHRTQNSHHLHMLVHRTLASFSLRTRLIGSQVMRKACAAFRLVPSKTNHVFAHDRTQARRPDYHRYHRVTPRVSQGTYQKRRGHISVSPTLPPLHQMHPAEDLSIVSSP